MKGVLISLIVTCISCQLKAQPKPTPQQLAWHDMEFYLFMHFGPNTFTDLEWGEGTEKEEEFNPVNLDCSQWCRIAKAAGAKGIIITAKHHDGFCLWPSRFSTHTVRESKWKNGKGDVLMELSLACKKYGLAFGVYISPWDRNHPKYGTPAYNNVFVNMLKEIFSNYGPVWELWWDGANGEGPNGKKQVYDFRLFENTVRKISPRTVIFSDIGPDIRWCGNENGIAGKTNWNMLDTAGFTRGAGAPPQDSLNTGNINGNLWIPAECDVSIRPGWFYHKNEDAKVKTPEQLFELYLKSVGRGANLLLNVPPDERGLISSCDSAALAGFKKMKDLNFSTDLMKNAIIRLLNHDGAVETKNLNDDDEHSFEFIHFLSEPKKVACHFNKEQPINTIVLHEFLTGGQSIRKFRLVLNDGKGNKKEIIGTTVGNKRILTFPSFQTSDLEFELISDNGDYSALSRISAYLIDENLIEK